LCNAFDLARIHLYGQEDETVNENTPINKRPSFIAMRELALKDNKVRKAAISEKIEKAFQDIAVDELADYSEQQEEQTQHENKEHDNKEWLELLEVDSKGNIKSTVDNMVLILENDKKIKGVIAIDEFRNNMVKLKPFKWDKVNRYLFGDIDKSNIRRYIEKKYGLDSVGKLQDAIDIIAHHNIFHPVRNYLNGLTWDGVDRCETLLIDYMGAEDNEYVRAVTRKWLAAGVARIFEPGCKMDYILCLQGKQGVKKSTFFNLLGGKWYNGSFTFSMIGKKESVEMLQGSWIVEIAEMAGLSKVEHQAVKAFVSNQRDEMRPAYGRYKMEYERGCIFGGSFNEDEPFTDPTGGRRYWPVRVVKGRDFDKLTSLVDQIWAEAYCLYMAGETRFLNDELEEEANKIQEEFTEKDVRLGDLLKYLELKVPEDWETLDYWQRREFVQNPVKGEGYKTRKRVTVMEIWGELFGGSVKDITKRDSRAINDMMKDAKDWEPVRFGSDGSRERGFKRVRNSRHVLFSQN
jgi:predicted P-loop ATPase